jgi:hypothetical protein
VSRFALAAVAFAAAGLLAAPGLDQAPVRAASGRVFYLSPSGSDQANGLSEATAWKTLARASQAQYQPGDRILLQGGAEFAGQLMLQQNSAGTATDPVTISSYGTGRPTIRATGTEGIKIYNAGGVEISGLNIVGDQAAYASSGGITFYTDQQVAGPLDHVVISDVDVSSFRWGIFFNTGTIGRGYQGVTISNSKLHDNRDTGLLTLGPDFDANNPSYAFSDVKVSGVTAYHNQGDPTNVEHHSGSGIILGSVNGGTIEQSSAYDNGGLCPASKEGPVGIWTYDSTTVTIQRNISYGNKTGGPSDGGGFDLDQNVSNSTLQYNLSYQNAGPGLMVYSAQQNGAQTGNTVRFNVSVGDAAGSGSYGGLTVAGHVANTAIYNNTIVARPNSIGQSVAVKLGMPGLTGLDGVTIRNNVLLSQGAGPAVSSAVAFGIDKAFLQANSYYRQGGGSPIQWGAKQYTSLKDWRAVSGQEKTSDGRGLGVEADPKLQDESATPTVTDPGQLTSVTQFALASDSPAGGRGLEETNSFQASAGTVDYFGATLGGGRPVSIGAAQPATALANTAITAGAASSSSSSSSWLLWTIAVVLLLLVGGGAFTVFGLQMRGRRRVRMAPPPGWGQPAHTIVVPSARADGQPVDEEQQHSGGRHAR